MPRVERLSPRKRWAEVAVVLTDDAGIRRINRAHLGRDEATDVISFCYAPIPGDGGASSAEVFVNVQRALAEGRRRRRAGVRGKGGGWGVSRELALYVAHGLDHLTGAGDRDPAGCNRMRRRELRWLRTAPAYEESFRLFL